mmetsp:Transcript_9798/g.17723  ORF Transcript_9798/g.17723 Transcript_9798/m.17723 type:complete len:289 (+) Transcript_9798:74-940(+)
MDAILAPPVPEWPGAVSSRFADKLHGKPQGKARATTDLINGPSENFARQGPARYMTDTRGLTTNECKKTILVPGSEAYDWKASKRSLPEPGADHPEKPQGKRLVEPAPRAVMSMGEKRHIRQVESKEEFADRSVGVKVIYRENGLRARDQPAREIDIGDELNRKGKPAGLLAVRNGITCKTYGDKPYKHPEYDRDFFKVGNLIVGAGFARGHFEKVKPRNSNTLEIAPSADGTRHLKSYGEKRREQLAREAEQEVEELTRQWEGSTLKESIPTYAEPVDSDDEVAEPG